MQIVQTYKRYPYYDFDNDENLKKIIDGKYGSKTKTDKNHVICACNSFMTIWLLTLPEKFREWYEYHHSTVQPPYEEKVKMDFRIGPAFLWFDRKKDYTRISPHALIGGFGYLPKTWNLFECFKYYLQQKEMWTTKSIEMEWANTDDDRLQDDLSDEDEVPHAMSN